MDKVKIDAHEVGQLNDIFAKAPLHMEREVKAVVSKGALNIKRDAQGIAKTFGRAPRYWRSITYDVYQNVKETVAEIGPDKDLPGRQAALGNLLEFGSVNNPPHPHMNPAAFRELPRFERALEDLSAEPFED